MQEENLNNHMNEDDITAATLAKLVGTELNVIDRMTESTSTAGPANKINIHSFLPQRHQQNRRSTSNKNVVQHQGMMFHAGVDEDYVQRMHPEPVYSAPPSQQLTSASSSQQTQQAIAATQKSVQVLSSQSNEDLTKILASIDKTLKSIEKTEKNIAKILTTLTTNCSDQNTNK